MDTSFLGTATAAGLLLLIVALLMSVKKRPAQDPEGAALLERRLQALRDNAPTENGPVSRRPVRSVRKEAGNRRPPRIEADEPQPDPRSAEALRPPDDAPPERREGDYQPGWKRQQ